MEQKSNDAAVKGAQTKPRKEEYALDMEQMSRNVAAVRDVQIKLRMEECACGMGQNTKMQQ